MKEKDKTIASNEEQQPCCHYATMFWQEIDGIVDNIDSYTEDKKQQKQSELEEAFGVDETGK